MNWIGLNTALEVIPRDSKGNAIPFLATPYVGDRRRRTRYHRRRTLRSQHPRQPERTADTIAIGYRNVSINQLEYCTAANEIGSCTSDQRETDR